MSELDTEPALAGAASDRGERRPIRVLHVTAVSASNYYLNNLAERMDRDEIRLFAATLSKPGLFVYELERRGVPSFALGSSARWQYPQAAYFLAQIVRREAIDIIHAHLFEPTVIGALVARRLERRFVVTRHHSDAVHKLPGRLRRSVYLAAERWICRRADHIIAPSRAVRDVLVAREGVPEDKVSLIPYGQTTERFAAVGPDAVVRVRGELGMTELSIVCVSRLHEEKGHVYLLEAFAGLLGQGLQAVLYLVGEGPERDRLAAITEKLGIEARVRFLGWRDDALALLAAANVVVHPSLHEALPSAVIEAVILGRPVVATDVSGVRDILGDSAYGTIVPPGDSEALRRALCGTIANLAAAGLKATQGGRAVLEYMDAGRVAREYSACYRKILETVGDD